MADYIRYSFAIDGDRVAIDDATQPSGVISLQSGYPPPYSLIPSNPSAKKIERDKFNQLMFLLSDAIRQYQSVGTPDFIPDTQNGGVDFTYQKYARCVRLGVAYESLIDGNTDVPPSANWRVVSSNATETLSGLVEKATQSEMNIGLADVFPDAFTILNGIGSSYGGDHGHIKLPNWLGIGGHSLILNFGKVVCGDLHSGNYDFTEDIDFNLKFPNQLLMAITGKSGDATYMVTGYRYASAKGMQVYAEEWGPHLQGADAAIVYFALGY